MTFETLIKILDALKQGKKILVLEEGWEGYHKVDEIEKDACIEHYIKYFINPKFQFLIYEQNKELWEMEVL